MQVDGRGDAFDRMAWLGGRLVVGRRKVGLQELREGRWVWLPGTRFCFTLASAPREATPAAGRRDEPRQPARGVGRRAR